MHLSFRKLKKVFPHLNERQLTLDDFYRVADDCQIQTLEFRLKRRGYCLIDLTSGDEFIFLKKGMEGLKLLETAFHELFHLVGGCTQFEANAFRLIAIIPAPYLENYDWLDENSSKYAFKLWRERLRLKFLYQI